jgi:signal transduction histidine kinase/ActR/RegA family two-component response regulator
MRRRPHPSPASTKDPAATRNGGSRRSASSAALALAAMRASTTALAAIRDGRCIVRNDRWVRVAADRSGPWRLASLEDGACAAGEHPTLEALALAQAAELAGRGESAWSARFERGDGDMVVELRLDRARVDAPPILLATICDVTERVRSERELTRIKEAMQAQERLRAVGELASGIAHDLNNTLHALRLRLSRLSGCVADCPEHREDLRVVERIASDAGDRVRRFQDLAGRRDDVPDESVDLAGVVANAVQVAHPDVGDPARRLCVDVKLPAAMPPVVGNAAELVHVFLSLFLNANDAMPGGGRVVVEGAVAPDGHVEILVWDEGKGIPSENLDRVFDPFFTTKGRRGTGLGLSMAAGVMRRLGGSIRAANRPAGGAMITLSFPRGRPAAARPAVPPPPRARARPRRVLVVDDDPDNLDAMRLVLAEHGHDVVVTASGLDAIARVEAGERYDTVLCDLGLGDTTGWDVAARIGAASAGTRILLVTGWAEEIPRDDPRRAHVARVMSKPLGVEELQEILHDAPRARAEVPASDRGEHRRGADPVPPAP